jgi:hypothetical protein
MAIGALTLHLLEPTAADADAAGGTGYALCYAAAALARLSCTGMLARSWEPAFVAPSDEDRMRVVLLGPEGSAGRGVLFVGAAMLLSVCIATPFFAAHMLDTLRFSYPTYLLAQGLLVGSKMATYGAWGRQVDRHGPVPVYRVAAFLVALVPVPWMFADSVWVVLGAQALSGCAWAGHEVAMLALTLGARDDRRRAVLVALQSLVNGGAQTLGGVTGSALSAAVGGAHAVMFGVSAAGRLTVALVAPFSLRAMAGRRVRTPASRVTGWRPAAGPDRQLLPPAR